jgi:hypothetical protein
MSNNQQLVDVSYHQATELKKLCFDWEVNKFYDVNKKYKEGYRKMGAKYHKVSNKKKAISCPSLELVSEWFRQVHKLHITIGVQMKYYFVVQDINNSRNLEESMGSTIENYPEALSLGIDQCIGIVIKRIQEGT